MMEHMVHRGMTGVTLEKEVFANLDVADDVSSLAGMLEVLVLALTVMQEEASIFGLQINWSKTKILQVPSSTSRSTVEVADGHIEVVDAFVYLRCMTDSYGGNRGEVLHQIGNRHSSVLHEYVRGGSESQVSGWKPSYASVRHTSIWNSLPSNVSSWKTLTKFCQHLISHLFHSPFATA